MAGSSGTRPSRLSCPPLGCALLGPLPGKLDLDMSTLWPRIEPLLPGVAKPARYIGCEEGAQGGTWHSDAVSWLLVYPDAYEIGLPNQGLQILYEILNERRDALAERTYAPWVDMEAAMRANGVPLFSLESNVPAAAFDVIGFSLAAELTFTNVLECLDLAGLPVRADDRDELDPLVIAGGHCCFNPEPLALHVDGFVLGDGEEVVGEITEVVSDWKQSLGVAWSARRKGRAWDLRPARQRGAQSPREAPIGPGIGQGPRTELLGRLARVEGVYVPRFYEARYGSIGGTQRLMETVPRLDWVPEQVGKRTIGDLGDWPYPKRQLVPLTEVVHDRLNVEVFRGCTRGCRFCQAGMITRPVRERSLAQVISMAEEGIARTGYDEVALTSLSSADFSGIEGAVEAICGSGATGTRDGLGPVSVSLPSLRVDAFTVGIASRIARGRRTGLTFAPEAGSWRLRKVINKLITEEDLYGALESAFGSGWQRVKLYFLLGVPTETDEDVAAIAELVRNSVAIGSRFHSKVTVTASVGGFVPKAHTPFQWFGQVRPEELTRRVELLRRELSATRGASLRWHDPAASVAEGLLSRGDRRLGKVLEEVWRSGGVFQEWSEFFDLGLFQRALDATGGQARGMSFEELVHRHREEDETLPWDHISAGLHKDFLYQEFRDALSEHGLPDCRWTPCYDCGACTEYGLEHIVASSVPPAGGSQGTGQPLEGSSLAKAGLFETRSLAEDKTKVPRRIPLSVSSGTPPHPEAPTVRLRIRYCKYGKLAWVGQRDLARVWERAFRRAGLPVAYSKGFSPHPRLSFGYALPTGAESLAEYLDVELILDAGLDALGIERLGQLLPEGMGLVGWSVLEPGSRSLQEAVVASTWTMQVGGASGEQVARLVEEVVKAPAIELPRTRKSKSGVEDLRGGILCLELLTDLGSDGALISADLASSPRTLRPSELLEALSWAGSTTGALPDARKVLWMRNVVRKHQWIEEDGRRVEPVPVEPGGTRHALERVS
jgi:radical SAM-linked protein